MWHPDNGPIRGQDSSLWPMTAQGTGHSLIMRVGGPGPDSLWLWPVGAGQIICLVKTKTKPHVMVHKYNLSKLHLHHQLWFQLGSSILTSSSQHRLNTVKPLGDPLTFQDHSCFSTYVVKFHKDFFVTLVLGAKKKVMIYKNKHDIMIYLQTDVSVSCPILSYKVCSFQTLIWSLYGI